MPQSPESVLLIYGAGGMGKSTLAATAIAHVWKTTGLRARVVGADGGGTTKALKILLDEGIAEYWPVDQWDEKSIFLTLDLATKGWWPADPTTANSPLLPGYKEIRPCPTCGGDSGAKGLTMVKACLSCGVTFASDELLPVARVPVNGLEKVGIVVFEGMTSFGDLLMRRLTTIDPSGGRSISDKWGEGDKDVFKISAPGQQHYMDAQNYLSRYVTNVRTIPVGIVLWTALEVRGEDEGRPLYGPKGPGKALTNVCIPWFTDVLHLDGVAKKDAKGVIVKDANGVEILERKLYLAPHFPADNPAYKFAAKTSAPMGGEMPNALEPDLRTYFKELDKAFDRSRKFLLG